MFDPTIGNESNELSELKRLRGIWLSKLDQELVRQSEYKLRNGTMLWYNNTQEIAIQREVAKLDKQISSKEIQPLHADKGSPDKEKVRAYAKGVIDNGVSITRTALAEQIQKTYPDMKYELRTYIDWIQNLFPDYTPLKPGRKKK